MKGQKEAVVELVKAALPGFQPGVDKAIDMLSQSAIQSIQAQIASMIHNGQVSYGKDANNMAEVRRYAKGMVINHLKKARDLNGGVSAIRRTTSSEDDPGVDTDTVGRHKGVDLSGLPDELKKYVEKL